MAMIIILVLQIGPSFRNNYAFEQQQEVEDHPTSNPHSTNIHNDANDNANSANQPYSKVHCVGENFLPKTATGYRSCQFRHLCFTTTPPPPPSLDKNNSTPQFLLFPSPQDQHLAQLLFQNMTSPYVTWASNFNLYSNHNIKVSTAPTTEGMLRQGIDQGWFPIPNIRSTPLINKNYQTQPVLLLPDNVVLVPVTFPNDHDTTTNIKNILWDFLLPLYNLLAMFDLQDKKLWLINLDDHRTSHTSHTSHIYDAESCNTRDCYYHTTKQMLTLMNAHWVNLQNLTTTLTKMPGNFSSDNQHHYNHQQLVCAKFGAAGMGALTDHGIHKKSHGERKKDYVFVQNSGRGPLLYNFRNHILKNLGLLHDDTRQQQQQQQQHDNDSKNKNGPLQISVMVSESKKSGIQTFQHHVDAVKRDIPDHSQTLRIQQYHYTHNNSTSSIVHIKKQIQMAVQTQIYISMMGHSAWPAFFLPPGSTLILFFNNGGEEMVRDTNNKNEATFPIKLDWDVWNNLGHLRVHWLPLHTTDEDDRLVKIIEQDLRRQRGEEEPQQTTDDGSTWNGIPVRLVVPKNQTSSSVHCIGGNFQKKGANVFRSCHYEHLCLDMDRREFVLHVGASSQTDNNNNKNNNSDLLDSTINADVSVGRTIRFSGDSAWSPRVVQQPLHIHYELPEGTIWAPFHAEQPNIHNPGHLLWDYFLPFYNLLAMFGLDQSPASNLLPINIDEGCTQKEDSPCWRVLTKFLPLLGVHNASTTFRSTRQSELHGPRQSNLVCAKHAVAGIGMLTDHGWNRHGQRIEDYRDVHNVGRGPLFFAFRNFVLRNMGIDEQTPLQRPNKIVFSTHSSKNPARRHSFQNQIHALRAAIPANTLSVEHHVLAKLSLREQVVLATQTAIFVSVVGGSASTATFMPRGSSVILFFNDVNEFTDHSSRKDFPCMIDWDFWNNAAHLNVHWLPVKTMNDTVNQLALIQLVKSEIAKESIDRTRRGFD